MILMEHLRPKQPQQQQQQKQKERNLLSASSPAPSISPALVLMSPVWHIYCFLASFLGYVSSWLLTYSS